jgi:hypothetical protein
MYKPRYIQYLNLPNLPAHLEQQICGDLSDIADQAKVNYGNYSWSDHANESVNTWCKQNICQDMYWGFQVMTGDIPVHQDVGTKIKLIYLLKSGGQDVKTQFWDADQSTMIDQHVIPVHQWHVLKADSYHSVTGIEPGHVRFSITGRIF